jgi:hypothetical protein
VYVPKRSQAPRIWLLVTAIILTLLFAETRSRGQRNSNLFLNGDSASVGAYVFIDGANLGKIKTANNSGLSGGTFWCHLNNGLHLLEVKKPGYKTFSTMLNFNGQDYLGITLER